jgi:hypothetical protein
VAATTAVRITHRRRNPWGPVCSAGRSTQQTSPVLLPAHLDRQVHRGDGPSCIAQRLTPSLQAGRRHHRRGDHPPPAAAPHGLGSDMARAPTSELDPQLGRPDLHICGELLEHVRASRELVGPAGMHQEAR